MKDPVLAESVPGWDEEIAEGHTPEAEEYGISSMTFRAERPFHPDRLARVLENVTGVHSQVFRGPRHLEVAFDCILD